jgi:hypothetical protein
LIRAKSGSWQGAFACFAKKGNFCGDDKFDFPFKLKLKSKTAVGKRVETTRGRFWIDGQFELTKEGFAQDCFNC